MATQLEWNVQTTGASPLARAVAAGLAGTATVTILNEVGRRTLRQAPHAEALGMRGVRALARRTGRDLDRSERYAAALGGEIVSNTLYYALAARSTRRPLVAGILLGAAAGAGAVFLPERIGLGRRPTRRTTRTAALSFGWYLAAGLAAGLAARALGPRSRSVWS